MRVAPKVANKPYNSRNIKIIHEQLLKLEYMMRSSLLFHDCVHLLGSSDLEIRPFDI